MADNNIGTEVQRALLDRDRELGQASIAINKEDRPQSVFRFEIDLSKARDAYDPFVINFPFKSLFVEACDDPNARINIKPTTNDEHQNHFSIGYKDSWNTSEIIPKAFLNWPLGTGKMTLVVFRDAEFKSGSQVSVSAGGVSTSDGSSVTTLALVTIANTAVEILPQDLSRKSAAIENKGTQDVSLGGATVTFDTGQSLDPGGVFKWNNTAALYAIGYGATTVKLARMVEK